MKSRVLLVTIGLMIAGCANYSIVNTGSQNVGKMTVVAGIPWNKAPSAAAPGDRTTWTVDGLLLNRMTFFDGIEDGKPLYDARKKAQFPVFRSDMLPGEVMETFEATLTKYSGSSVASTSNLRPTTMGGEKAFRFDFDYVGADDVGCKGFAVATIKDTKLYMIAYEGAEIYYHDKVLAQAERTVDSTSFK